MMLEPEATTAVLEQPKAWKRAFWFRVDGNGCGEIAVRLAEADCDRPVPFIDHDQSDWQLVAEVAEFLGYVVEYDLDPEEAWKQLLASGYPLKQLPYTRFEQLEPSLRVLLRFAIAQARHSFGLCAGEAISAS